MTEAILIAGLPGSGKTYLGKKLSSETGYLFIDDASKTFGASRAEALSALQRLKGISGVIIADPLLCYEGSIENAKVLMNIPPAKAGGFADAPEGAQSATRADGYFGSTSAVSTAPISSCAG